MRPPEETLGIGELWERAPVGLLSTDADGVVRRANRTLLAWVGRTAEEVVGVMRFPDLLSAGGRIYYEIHLAPMLRLQHGFGEIALTLEGPDRGRNVLVTAKSAGGEIDFVLFEAELRRGYERELDAMRTAAETRSLWLRQVEALAGIGAWSLDLDTAVITWSDHVFVLHDLPVGAPPIVDDAISFYCEADRERIKRHIEETRTTGRPFSFEADLVSAAGRSRRVRATGELERWGGRPKRIVGVIQDISAQHEAELALWRSAHIDGLSGIANRTLFQKRLREMIAAVAGDARGDAGLALLLVDLDGFKEINDRLGHDAGDEVIRCIAGRFKGLCGPLDCARLGGDEFALLLTTGPGSSAVNALGQAILEEIRREVSVHGERVTVSGSVGTAHYPSDANTPEELLRCADIALYASKRSGRARASAYSREIGDQFDTRRAAIEMVRQAGVAGTLVPVYQPFVRLADGRAIGAEALARIRGGDGDLITPATFWPAMSDPESARQIDRHMLRLVTGQMASWRDAGHDPGVVNLNVSHFSFQDGDYAESVIRSLERLALPPTSLQIEVTESVFLGDSQKLVETAMAKLVAAGVSIALDDFGTGHASLVHLRDYPIEWIKIDTSFVKDLPSTVRSKAIVKAMIDLAHALSIKIVAEGIETEAQLEFLRAAGCDAGQGFYFGEGRPAVDPWGAPIGAESPST